MLFTSSKLKIAFNKREVNLFYMMLLFFYLVVLNKNNIILSTGRLSCIKYVELFTIYRLQHVHVKLIINLFCLD